jgi:hypothetical protein
VVVVLPSGPSLLGEAAARDPPGRHGEQADAAAPPVLLSGSEFGSGGGLGRVRDGGGRGHLRHDRSKAAAMSRTGKIQPFPAATSSQAAPALGARRRQPSGGKQDGGFGRRWAGRRLSGVRASQWSKRKRVGGLLVLSEIC